MVQSNFAVYQYREGRYLCLDLGYRVRGIVWGEVFDSEVTYLFSTDRKLAEKVGRANGPLAVKVGGSFIDAKHLLVSADVIEVQTDKLN